MVKESASIILIPKINIIFSKVFKTEVIELKDVVLK